MKSMLFLAAPVLLLLASSFTPVTKNPRALGDTKDVLYKELSRVRFVSINIEGQYKAKEYSAEVKYSPRFRYLVTTVVDDRNVKGKLLVVLNKADNKCVYIGMSNNLHNIPPAYVLSSMKKNSDANSTAVYSDCMCDCVAIYGTFFACLLVCALKP